jgi:hypothetical protein
MFLLRSRRAARYGKWIDALPPRPEPSQLDRSYALGDALLEISINAPEKDGNPDDWGDDDEEEQQ